MSIILIQLLRLLVKHKLILFKFMKVLKICLLIICLSLSLQNEQLSNELCSKIVCSDSLTTGCAQQSAVQTFSINKTSCAADKYCPYLSAKITNPATTVQCKDRVVNSRVFPGGECQSDANCIYGTCTNSRCVGKAEGESCDLEKNFQCEIGTFCATNEEGKGVCKLQSPTYECKDDFECPNTHGCSYNGEGSTKTGDCLEYYSLESGTPAPSNNHYSFCKSGFAAEDKDKNMICRSVNLKKPEGTDFLECLSDEDCVYQYETVDANKAKVTKETSFVGTCDCGFNKDGKRFCRPGDLDNPVYKDYISKLKSTLSETRCHTEERDDCHFSKVHTQFKFTELEVLNVDYIRNHLFAGNGEDQKCVKATVFPNYNPDLVMPRCPKFEIKAAAEGEVVDKCAESNGYLEKDNYKVTIKKCPNNGICKISNSLFDKDASSVSCNNSKQKSLPGEACNTSNDECETVRIDGVDKNECKDKKCVGVEATKTCTSDNDCVVGNYCKTDATSAKTCAPQITDQTTTCTNSYQCANDRLCLNSKCIAAYSVALGVKISSIESELRDVACSSGYNYNGVCAERRYAEKVKASVEKGLIKCSYMDLCYYDISFGTEKTSPEKRTVTEFCSCGVNEKGDSFCPYSIHDHYKNRQKTINDINIKALKSAGVHTKNRRRISSKDDALCLDFYSNVAFHNGDAKFYNTLFDSPTCQKADTDPSDTPTPPTPTPDPTSSDSTKSNSTQLKIFTLLLAFIVATLLA